MILLTLWIVIIIARAYGDSVKIEQGITINHRLNALHTSLLAMLLVVMRFRLQIFSDWPLSLSALILLLSMHWIGFDIALNLIRGKKVTYMLFGTPEKSTIDSFFRNKGNLIYYGD